jgi:hypothetical protein
MAEHGCGEHCPFLNRSDRRCSDKLSLDRIAHAFDHCFGEYKDCPVYLELLVERRVRRLCGLLTPAEQGSAQIDVPRRRPVVQLTVAQPGHSHAHHYPQHTAAAQGVPVASGV